MFANQFFDISSYDDPVTEFLDDSLFFMLDPTVSKRANFLVQESKITLQDDVWIGRTTTNSSYASVSNIIRYEDSYNSSSGHIAAVYVKLDKQYEQVNRKVNTVLTLLAQVGGLQRTLLAIGMIIVTFVAQKVFMAQIVHKVYQIRKYENLNIMNAASSEDKADEETKETTTSSEPIPESWFFGFREYLFQKNFKKKVHIKDEDIQSMLFAFLNR